MPQLDIYLLNTFVWSILIFFVILYVINTVYVNLNLFFVINLRYLKYFIDKTLMFFSINNYNQIKQGKVLVNFFSLNKLKIMDIKNKIINNDFINVSVLFYNLYTLFNINTNQINSFIKLNIESSRNN